MDGVAHAGWWQLGGWIGWGALGFSILLFGLFAVRVPWFFLVSWVHTRRTRRWRIHDAIVRHATERGREALYLDALARRQASTGGEVRMIALGLEGAFDLDAKDDPQKTEWRFDRLARELAEPKEPRRQVKRAEALTSDQ
jgi:hypothetical protein